MSDDPEFVWTHKQHTAVVDRFNPRINARNSDESKMRASVTVEGKKIPTWNVYFKPRPVSNALLMLWVMTPSGSNWLGFEFPEGTPIEELKTAAENMLRVGADTGD